MVDCLKSVKELMLDILYPRFCFGCGREGNYLCEDCFSLIDIADRLYCPFCQSPKTFGGACPFCRRKENLSGLFCASSYENPIIKKLISNFKYEPYIKELAVPLSFLIITHLIKSGLAADLKDFRLIPAPLHKKRLRRRGFNQSEEMAKIISDALRLPMIGGALTKIKNTPSQVELKKEEREKNVSGAYFCPAPEAIKNRKIIVVDDVATTLSTLEECAKTLKAAGAKEVWGMVIARGRF